jgi:dUTP pyrophosphatase
MQVKVKKLHPDAVIPRYSKAGDAGMDMTAVSAIIMSDGSYIEYGTGISIEVPEGYVGLLFARSSISKTSLILANHVGVLDSGYRGEIKFRFKDTQMKKSMGSDNVWKYYASESAYEVGNRIGQLIILPYPQIEMVEVDELSDSYRGAGGFGSTGK